MAHKQEGFVKGMERDCNCLGQILIKKWAILLLVFTLHNLNPTSSCVSAQGTPAEAADETTGSLSALSGVLLGNIAQEKAQVANGILAKFGLKKGTTAVPSTTMAPTISSTPVTTPGGFNATVELQQLSNFVQLCNSTNTTIVPDVSPSTSHLGSISSCNETISADIFGPKLNNGSSIEEIAYIAETFRGSVYYLTAGPNRTTITDVDGNSLIISSEGSVIFVNANATLVESSASNTGRRLTQSSSCELLLEACESIATAVNLLCTAVTAAPAPVVEAAVVQVCSRVALVNPIAGVVCLGLGTAAVGLCNSRLLTILSGPVGLMTPPDSPFGPGIICKAISCTPPPPVPASNPPPVPTPSPPAPTLPPGYCNPSPCVLSGAGPVCCIDCGDGSQGCNKAGTVCSTCE